jgi:hypothetical protein
VFFGGPRLFVLSLPLYLLPKSAFRFIPPSFQNFSHLICLIFLLACIKLTYFRNIVIIFTHVIDFFFLHRYRYRALWFVVFRVVVLTRAGFLWTLLFSVHAINFLEHLWCLISCHQIFERFPRILVFCLSLPLHQIALSLLPIDLSFAYYLFD